MSASPLPQPEVAQPQSLLREAPPRAAYVHVPFCIHRCGYCDFTVITGRDDLLGTYIDGLERELQTRLREPCPVETLFLGGGTPTYLPPPELERLLQLVRHWFPLATGGEFSTEANPADLDHDRCAILHAQGVNRVSLGVQSFDADCLKVLERDHTPERVLHVVEELRRFCGNLSFDLIFGVPGQSLTSWEATLQQAFDLHPQNVSTYGLTFEKGTRFWTRREKGEFLAADEDLELAQYEVAHDRCAAHGFEQYEISSYAQPGFRSRHNQVYWRGLPYIGVGPGAASYLHHQRLTNHRSVTTWLRKVLGGGSPVMEHEELTPRERAHELLALGLRRCDGLERAAFQQLTGYDWDTLAGAAITRFLRLELLELVGATTLRLTRAGRRVADAILGDLLTSD